MRELIQVPCVIYLALLDRLGDAWILGECSLIQAYSHYEHTIEMAEAISHLQVPPRCAIRISA